MRPAEEAVIFVAIYTGIEYRNTSTADKAGARPRGISDAGNNRGETLVKGFSGRERDLKTE